MLDKSGSKILIPDPDPVNGSFGHDQIQIYNTAQRPNYSCHKVPTLLASQKGTDQVPAVWGDSELDPGLPIPPRLSYLINMMIYRQGYIKNIKLLL